jgi:hypothetical protein
MPIVPASASSDALDVLAWVLCPARAFAAHEPDAAATARALRPIKAELCRRFRAARAALIRN